MDDNARTYYSYNNGRTWWDRPMTDIDLAKEKCRAYFAKLNADERYWR